MAAAVAALPTLAHAGPFDAAPSADSSNPDGAPSSMLQRMSFAVMRNGTKIGDYSMNVTSDGKTQTVDFVTDIKVEVLMFTAYKLHHEGHEVWTNGAFVSYKGVTDDNGKHHSVSMAASPTGATLTADGKHTALPKGSIPGSIWNAKFLTATTVVDPDNGKIVPIKVDDLGSDQITVEGAPVKAHHYHIDGLDRDVWLVKGSPVRFKLKGSDNSTIVSELQPSPPQ